MGRTREEWIALAKKRIVRILSERRVSYNRHFEIKISEAGPRRQRVEPMLLSDAVKEMLAAGELLKQYDNPRIVTLPDFGKPGDTSRLKAFLGWHQLFLECSREEKLCGMVLEHITYEAALKSGKYHIIGSGPIYDQNGDLFKPPHSEVIHYNKKQIYGGEHGSGLDLFLIHNDLKFPIGVEVKNIREWVYPSSWQIWRLIARAASLECLPVLVTRKIPFITRAGLFKNCGILGFESHFQYYSTKVKVYSKYRFEQNIVNKDRLGFADIKYYKEGDEPPERFVKFFRDNLYEHAEEYYERFMRNLPILKKYAIDYKLAEEKLSGYARSMLYQQFKEEIGQEDPELPDEEPDVPDDYENE